MTNYLSTGVLILAIIGTLVVIAGMVLLFLFAPKLQQKIHYKRSIATVPVSYTHLDVYKRQHITILIGDLGTENRLKTVM